MKPLYLKMSSFGPYKNEAEIDFSAFGGSGIYIITGDTGAGKTTVFDAIAFALYGQASGGKDRRQTKSFRSDYAEAGDKTYVEFKFSHNGKIYTIRRNPEYAVPGRKTGVKADAEMASGDGRSVITGAKSVTAAVSELLGLDAEQFSRASMIAQGDFLKILHAESGERTKLFRKIFNTEIYDDAKNRLGEMSRNAGMKRRDIINGILNDASSVRMTPHADKAEEFSDCINRGNITGAAELLDEFNGETQKLIYAADESSQLYNELMKRLTAEIESAKTLNSRIDKLEKAESRLKALYSRREEIDSDRKALKRAKQAERVYPAEQMKNSAERELKNASLKKEESEKRYSYIASQREKIKNELDAAQEKLEESQKLKDRAAELDGVPNLLRNVKSCENELEGLRKRYLAEQKELDIKTHEYLTLHALYFAGQAGILASELYDGEPCPVCGSTVHPKKAEKTENTPDKDAVERADAKRGELRDKLEKTANDGAAARTRLDEMKKSLVKANIGEDETAESVAEKITALRHEADKASENFDSAKKRFDGAEKEFNALRGKIAELDESLESRKKQLAENAEKYSSAVSEAGFDSESDYISAKMTGEDMNALEKKISGYGEEVHACEVIISSEKKEIGEGKRADIASLESKRNETEALQKETGEKIFTLKSTLGVNLEAAKKLRDKASKLEKATNEYVKITELYDTVSGNLRGRAKIELEAFVQQYYFNRVINAANERLRTLTSGRFTLRRKASADTLASKTGLDLDVFDFSTGKIRDVHTLSGGESFMASLSLALGLCDAVGSENGANSIDSMFIDEGFGSLDGDSLDRALKVLDELSDGKRLIGVISHVPALGERIDKKIIIEKTPVGSRLTTEV